MISHAAWLRFISLRGRHSLHGADIACRCRHAIVYRAAACALYAACLSRMPRFFFFFSPARHERVFHMRTYPVILLNL